MVARPFIVPIAHYDGTDRTLSIDVPLSTITANPKGGSHALVVPTLAKLNPQRAEVCAMFLAKHFGGHETPGTDLANPISTVTAADHHALVATSLVKLRGTCRDGRPVTEPTATISAQGTHLAVSAS